MKTIPSPNAALYTEDTITTASINAIAASGFTTVIVGLFHIHKDGSLVYNNRPVDSSIISIVKSIKSVPGTSVKTVLFSIGGGNWLGHPASVSDSDYPQMKATWTNPAPGQTNTSKQNILNFMASANIDGLDLDYEPETTPFDETFIATVANEIKAAGYMVTAAPYVDMPNWQNVLKNTAVTQGASIIGNNFSWWNLQTYGGAYYPNWANGLKGIASEIGLTSSEIEAFLLPGYKPQCGDSSPGSDISYLRRTYPSINGGFIWRYAFIKNCLAAKAQSIIAAV